MISWAGAFLLLLGFLVFCRAFRLVARTGDVLACIENALATLADKALQDDEKENTMQRYALQLFRLFGVLAAGGFAALLLPLGALWISSRAGLVPWDAVLAKAVSWEFLGVTLGGSVIGYLIWRRRGRRVPRSPSTPFENRYSTADRLLHDVAFSTGPLQVVLANLEERMNRTRLARVSVTQPVFITALPRAGTTLLLELCAGLDEFVTHTYRHMPFVLTPLWWERMSRRFRVHQEARERAHGDGMFVGPDSPEAFEEILWFDFWREKYEADRIRTWDDTDSSSDFVRFFESHMQKLAAASGGRRPFPNARYVSKNNANIARVSWILDAIPGAQFVIPFRSPVQHAASLLRQHLNFLKIHSVDPFARRYMAAIGHFDFGANLRPIDFDDWLGGAAPSPTTKIDFWLQYWMACYRHLARITNERVLLLDFEALCDNSHAGLAGIADFLCISDRRNFEAQHQRIRLPRHHAVHQAAISSSVLHDATALHAQMVERAAYRVHARRN